MAETADFTLGIEEEYLLVDPGTGRLAAASDALMADLGERIGDRISPEFLTCQIEVGTGVCDDIAAARADLGRLRRAVADVCEAHGVAPIAASCHPFGDWRAQDNTAKDRYDTLEQEMGAIAQRLLIGGMHVHVGIADAERRIALVNGLRPFLPLILALSCSSPFWQSRDTGLASYRLSVFDALPRSGLPPALRDWADYQRLGAVLIDLGLIEDRSKIWWDVRPSDAFPTVETRICDMPSRMEDTLAIAALIQVLMRFLSRRLAGGIADAPVDRFLVAENRWRAQRYGPAEPLIDADRRALVPVPEMLSAVREAAAEDVAALDVGPEMSRLSAIAAADTSADRQRRRIATAGANGMTRQDAMVGVVTDLRAEFLAGVA